MIIDLKSILFIVNQIIRMMTTPHGFGLLKSLKGKREMKRDLQSLGHYVLGVDRSE